jgi:hypothetical protein
MLRYPARVLIPLDVAIQEVIELREKIDDAGGFVTVTSLADRLGVSKARASEIAQREDFPPPVWREGQSKFWTGNSVDAWRELPRPVGRPPTHKVTEEAVTDGAGDSVTNYVVVTRKDRLPVDRFMTIESAADYIVREKAFARWTVMAQEANKITASTPYRRLRPTEQEKLERRLYPTLFE